MKSTLLLCAAVIHGSLAFAAESKPNVIYILADDLGYGDLSCYGQTKLSTPNIDRLATEGVKFTDHYSGNTVCSPSRASLMTGQHSGVCYLRGNVTGEPPLDPGMTVLPEVFKAAGYATGAFGKWGLGHTVGEGANNPLSHGFDEFHGWKSQVIAHTYFPNSVIHNGKEIPLQEGTYVPTLIMDQARDFIRGNAQAGTPFFCYIPTAIPHAAMHAPAFTSDNGAHKEGGHDPVFWNSTGGLRGHKRDMHEGGIRTPMLARWPGVIQPGRVTGHISAFWDVLPTVCELLQQPVPPQNTGISFLPSLRGEDLQARHEALYFEFCSGLDQKITSQAVRMDQWKAFIPGGGAMEIYDLGKDPFETKDLAAERADLVRTMQAYIQKTRVPLPEQGDMPFETKTPKKSEKKQPKQE